MPAATVRNKVPSDAALEAAIKRSRQLLNRRAMVAAVASAVPVPGLDLSLIHI